jgi:regulator of protease activity HflC (stomatin/prohibitin superfamily)
MSPADPRRATTTTREIPRSTADGYTMAAVGVLLILLPVASFVFAFAAGGLFGGVLRVLLIPAGIFVLVGLYMLQPNEAAILTLFGRYMGTDRSAGLRWANPLFAKRRISLRARNLNMPTLKVNDKRGNPAQAVFDIDDFEHYVGVQAEAALRHLATQFAYDEGEDLAAGEPTLRSGEGAVMALKAELQARFDDAGVVVEDAKLSHLAYAPEIAQVMLRRQQAEAIISARQKIVQGAVSMVEAALTGLSERRIVELDDERKAAMVSNLLVVLCSDKDTQPIVNTGTLYT